MDHKEQHHQKHEHEREHHKKEQKEHEQRQEKNAWPIHPAWLFGLAAVLAIAALLIWTFLL
jgi:hypothetical protein